MRTAADNARHEHQAQSVATEVHHIRKSQRPRKPLKKKIKTEHIADTSGTASSQQARPESEHVEGKIDPALFDSEGWLEEVRRIYETERPEREKVANLTSGMSTR